jgi:putative SOS response-associated peptidase YedK
MCYHTSKDFKKEDLITHYDLERYYGVLAEDEFNKQWGTGFYHENGFDFHASPVLIDQSRLGLFTWGLIPAYTKSAEDAKMIRTKTLNCISEEMFDKPSFRDVVKAGQRCLIPMTGFFEWKWQDLKGKEKTPYYIYLKKQRIFSVAGLYAIWHDRTTNIDHYTFTVLTTGANGLMSEIHNSKKRMPVILPKHYEKDWLNPSLTNDDVLALCKPYDDSVMAAHQISKLITSKKQDSNVPQVLEKVESDRLF